MIDGDFIVWLIFASSGVLSVGVLLAIYLNLTSNDHKDTTLKRF